VCVCALGEYIPRRFTAGASLLLVSSVSSSSSSSLSYRRFPGPASTPLPAPTSPTPTSLEEPAGGFKTTGNLNPVPPAPPVGADPTLPTNPANPAEEGCAPPRPSPMEVPPPPPIAPGTSAGRSDSQQTHFFLSAALATMHTLHRHCPPFSTPALLADAPADAPAPGK